MVSVSTHLYFLSTGSYNVQSPQLEPVETNTPTVQKLKPPSYLPLSRNYGFLGRIDEIDWIEQALFVQQTYRKIAVVGPGGIGKTQVALAFAHSVLEKHPDVSVFWVHASSLEAFQQACRQVASVVGIADTEGGKKEVKEQVQRHLSSERAARWVLVVDGADDMEVLDGSDGEMGLLDYLPGGARGLTLFTARHKRTAHELAGSGIVDVETLDLTTASSLFKVNLTRKDYSYERPAFEEILQELDCLPLSIIQAAAYLNCNTTSVEEYLSLLRSTDQDLISVMSRKMRDSTQYQHAANAVAKTWLVSFVQIIRRNADAAALLQYMSCIDWKAIPRSILPAIEPEARMTAAIGTLCAYSFITPRRDGKTYDMHRLVHVAAGIWLQQKGLVVETQRKALVHLSRIFPSDDWDNRETWREYLPHAARMGDPKMGGPIGARATLYLKVGRCLQSDGQVRDAVSWLEESRKLRSDLPEDDAHRLLTEHVLAMAYQANGQVKKAVGLLEHVVAIRAKMVAATDPDRLASQHELAIAYQANGQVKDAVRLLEHVVAVEKRVLAEDHLDRLASQQQLASAYLANGQVKEAARLLEQVVTVEGRVLGEDHPDRLHSQHELASTYLANAQIEEAVKLLERVVAIRERVLAEDHPDRLASQHELAILYEAVGMTDNLESQLSSSADEQGSDSSSAGTGTARLKKTLSHAPAARSMAYRAPFQFYPSQHHSIPINTPALPPMAPTLPTSPPQRASKPSNL